MKSFEGNKRCGLIQPEGGGRDVYIHIKAVEKAGLTSLNKGQKVSFDLVTKRGKVSAENLRT